MSRTHKDAPYKIRERRLGIRDSAENCPLCADGPSRTTVTGFTAIFFAHELTQLEAFVALAEEEGFAVESREVRGYLSTSLPEEALLNRRINRRESVFDGFLDPHRAIYSSPSGSSSTLLWNGAGRFLSAEKVNDRLSRIYGSYEQRAAWSFLVERPHVSHKENIFTVVSVSKESSPSRIGHYHGHDDGMSYLLYGHCHCGYCTPDEQGSRTRIRTVSNELKKVFNGGDHEAIEEIAGELVRSGSGYRDTMLC